MLTASATPLLQLPHVGDTGLVTALVLLSCQTTLACPLHLVLAGAGGARAEQAFESLSLATNHYTGTGPGCRTASRFLLTGQTLWPRFTIHCILYSQPHVVNTSVLQLWAALFSTGFSPDHAQCTGPSITSGWAGAVLGGEKLTRRLSSVGIGWGCWLSIVSWNITIQSIA